MNSYSSSGKQELVFSEDEIDRLIITNGTGGPLVLPTHVIARPDKVLHNNETQHESIFFLTQTDFYIDRSVSSTKKRPIPEVLERIAEDILNSDSEEEFEYGYVSNLSLLLNDFIERFGIDAIRAIQLQIPRRHISVDVVVETLHTLGRSRQLVTHEERLQLLISFLYSGLARIRSAAALGLAYMDDVRSIPALENALESENRNSAKEYYKSALEQLKKTATGN